ncbi:mycofactocin precursor MftA [Streptomyces sp. NPDC051985]
MNELQTAQTAEVTADEAAAHEPLIEADELIEEVSIDGMCGVY